MKQSQLKRVESDLKYAGQVSRNYYLDLPYDKITRLSEIIRRLRVMGYDIVTEETDRDTIYHCKPKRIEHYRIPETGEVFEKKIYV